MTTETTEDGPRGPSSLHSLTTFLLNRLFAGLSIPVVRGSPDHALPRPQVSSSSSIPMRRRNASRSSQRRRTGLGTTRALVSYRWETCGRGRVRGRETRAQQDTHNPALDFPQAVHYYRNTHMQPPSLEFAVQPTSGVPIYRQLMDQIRALMASGRLKPGDRLPSVRQMAADLQVNMMTVSKAYARLEADGVLERERGLGMRIPLETLGETGAAAKASLTERQQELRPFAEELATRAWQLKLTDDQALSVVKSVLKERKS